MGKHWINKICFIGPVYLKILPGSSVSSSSTDDSDTPFSRHFLPCAFDFMCLVRFPVRKEINRGAIYKIELSMKGYMKGSLTKSSNALWIFLFFYIKVCGYYLLRVVECAIKTGLLTFSLEGKIAVLTDIGTNICVSADVFLQHARLFTADATFTTHIFPPPSPSHIYILFIRLIPEEKQRHKNVYSKRRS